MQIMKMKNKIKNMQEYEKKTNLFNIPIYIHIRVLNFIKLK